MPIKARCPTCGKSARFPDSDLGLPAVCAACGGRYMLPRHVSREPSGPLADGTAPGIRVNLGLSWIAWMIIGIAVASAGLAVAIVLKIALRPPTYTVASTFTPRPPPQTTTPAPAPPPLLPALSNADAQRVFTLKNDAEALVSDRLYQDAHRKYLEIESIVAGHAITDPGVKNMIEAARAQREDLFKRFIQPNDPLLASTTTSSASTRPATTRPVALTKRPPLHPVPEKLPDDSVSDAEIGKAIARASNFLLSLFDEKTNALTSSGNLEDAMTGGSDALSVYALLQAGRATDDPRLSVRNKRIEAMIEAMKRANLNAGSPQTYARGIRATALALFDRPQDRAVLKDDVAYLLKTHKQGAYAYNSILDEQSGNAAGPNGFRFKGDWDNSNSQYGLLGVWAGADTGAVSVPRTYWSFVEQHWTGTQREDGTWPYKQDGDGRLSMTVAGVASLFVTQDYLYGSASASAAASRIGRPPFSAALQRALKWLEEGDHVLGIDQTDLPSYTAYGIERAGLASGFKYFGVNDWYRKLAAQLLKRQTNEGGWGDERETSFYLLFLSRGRHPVLMNKIRFDTSEPAPAAEAADAGGTDAPDQTGFWNNHPRDLANLSRFASRQLERDLNFQVVPLNRDAADWLDSPILYLASQRPPRLSEDDKRNLKAYVEAGGLLFTHADGDAPEFNQFAKSLANSLFGEKYPMRDLPMDHPIYSMVFKVSDPPKLRAVSNGSRLLMLHAPTDIARFWQSRDDAKNRSPFDLGTNLFLYAAGKRDLRNRLDSLFISEPKESPPNGKVAVARLSYAGNWDPEPGAFTRFSRWMHRQTGTGLDVKPVPLSSLTAQQAATLPIVHLTGTEAMKFTESDARALRAYVDAGGVVLIDPCGGSAAFREAVSSELIAKAFPDVRPREVGAGHPLVTAGPPGMDDLAKPRVRLFTTQVRKETGTGSITALSSGKGHVILLSLDMTSGLLGTNTWGIAGYDPAYAQELLKNVIFWTMDGQREK